MPILARRLAPALALVILSGCDRTPEEGSLAQPVSHTATEPLPSAGERVRAALRADSRRELEASPFPALLPSDTALARAAVVTSGPAWFAASIPQGNHTIALHGARPRQDLPPLPDAPPPRDRVRGLPASVTVNEGIRSVTWEERGVAWSLEVECYHPFEDPRCTEETFARALAESLVTVGGAQ